MTTTEGRLACASHDPTSDPGASTCTSRLQFLSLDVHNPVFAVSSLTIIVCRSTISGSPESAARHRSKGPRCCAAAIFHWGVHGCAMFALVAFALAFAAYNLGLALGTALGVLPRISVTWPHRLHTASPRTRQNASPWSSGWHLAHRGRAGPSVRHPVHRHDQGAADRRHHLRRETVVVEAVRAQQPELALFRMLELCPSPTSPQASASSW